MNQYTICRKKALVIEDEPVISSICKRTLTAEGFDVDIAVNGLVAKELIQDKTYDLFLSDIRTPKMNGIEFYRYLEQTQPELARRIIFTTGDVLSNNIEQFLKEVKSPYLAKPFDPDQLRKVIKDNFTISSSIEQLI
jgi:CheY-like chemotaxis protein